MMPKLGEGMVFVPYSTFLLFNLTIEMGQANNTVVQNVGRNLVKNFKVIFGGKTISDVERADLYGAYHDMVTCEEDMMMGITTENYRKLRTDAGDKTSNAEEVVHTSRYGNTYHIPLSHPILDDHGVFYQKELDDLRFEIKLANKGEIVVTSDSTKGHDFELTNIQLEYCTIRDERLSAQAASEHQAGRTFVFDDVHLFQTAPAINLATQKSLSLHVNTPRRCMKGLMLFFVKTGMQNSLLCPSLRTCPSQLTAFLTSCSLMVLRALIFGMPSSKRWATTRGYMDTSRSKIFTITSLRSGLTWGLLQTTGSMGTV